MSKSCYTLEIFAPPGGVRKAHLYALSSVAEIQKALQMELGDPSWLDMWLEYGQSVWLSAYQQGQLVFEQDLQALQLFAFDIEGYGTFPVVEEPAFEGLDANFFETFPELVEELSFRAFVDWSKLNLPKLERPLLSKGDDMLVKEHYTDSDTTGLCEKVMFGWQDIENGCYADELPPDDPLVTLEVPQMLSNRVIFR